jgi:PAS domain S-box-containing protein
MTALLTNTGLPFLEEATWGMHLCQFYENGQDLLDVQVPYFKAGLDNDELCVWITSEPLGEGEAREAMTKAVPGFERYLRRRQMEIVPSTAWYRPDGSFTPRGALMAGSRIRAVARKRFPGLRVSGNAGLLCRGGWEVLTRRVAEADGVTGEYRAMTICSYPLALCGVWESLDLMATHQLALVKRGGAWQVVKNSALAGMSTALKETAERYRTLFEDSERRYRLLADNTSDVIWVTDMDLRPVYLSPSVTRLLGYTVAEALEGDLETMLTADSRRRARATFRKVMALELAQPGGRSGAGDLELQFRHKDGSLVWVDATVGFLRDSSGRPVQILGILHDISGRKQADERLQHSMGMLERTVESAIQAIASTVETKDVYTAGHQRRVTQLACAIALEMGLPAPTCRVIRIAGLLHDLGKISLPTDILTKPGQLTHLEMAVIRTHPQVAYDVLKRIESFDRIALVVLQHHERMDGSGYPSGLRGDQILPEARVLAVADVIEAMFSYRPYRPALGLDRALDEVSRNSGSLYDPDVVSACLKLFHQGNFQFAD